MAFFHAIKRFLLILIAFACVAVIAGYGVATVELALGGFEHPLVPFVAFGGFATILIALWAAVPAAVFVLIAEWRSWRALSIYCGFAIVLGLAIGAIVSLAWWYTLAGVVLGAFGASIFWAIAGRNAGCLKNEKDHRAEICLRVLLGSCAAVMAVVLTLQNQ